MVAMCSGSGPRRRAGPDLRRVPAVGRLCRCAAFAGLCRAVHLNVDRVQQQCEALLVWILNVGSGVQETGQGRQILLLDSQVRRAPIIRITAQVLAL